MSREALHSARRMAAERRWAELADLACELTDADTGTHPELAYLAADGMRRTGDITGALPLARSAAAVAERQGDMRLRLRTTNLLGMLAYESGDLPAAEDHFERLLELAAEARDDEFAARASNNLGVLASVRGERELALTAYQRAVAAYQRLQYGRGLAQTHYNLGIVYRDLDFPDEAEGHFSLALGFAEETESTDITALAEAERALLCVASGDGHLAEKLAERSLEKMRRLGDPLGAANAVRALAAAANARGEGDLALHRLAEALATVEKHPDLLLRAEIQRDRGRLLADRQDTAGARLALHDSIESFTRLGAAREAASTAALVDRLAPDSAS
ncbi:MAG TPA: tetratricopeptide repeat protein [Longimicrobiaceae bacterium]|nr:tetratricopeptide repeat protein [Longimicrobiaceae bacterium]